MRIKPWLVKTVLSLVLSACQVLPTKQVDNLTNRQITTSTVPLLSDTATARATVTLKPVATKTPIMKTPTKMLPSNTPTMVDGAIFEMCSPLAEETIPELWEIVSDPYNPPPPGSDERHQGVDFSHYRRKERLTIEGEVVQSVLSGRVAAAIQDRLPYGNMVIIETPGIDLPQVLADELGIEAGESLYLLYAHMQNAPQVVLGEMVYCGQEIGTVGMTGYNIVNPHLHLETRIGLAGGRFESMAFYDTSATVEEMDNYLRWRTSGDFRHFDPMMLFDDYLQSSFSH
jgi:murein DD-endopeptidase MepM/ murein hydrolase activator NlpD